MTVVDASALVAILAHEPERLDFLKFLIANPSALSPIGYWEAAIAARRVRGENGMAELDALLSYLNISVIPATAATAIAAIGAEARFGKRTAAKLNLGDCFAYALATELNAPLLFKGNDFTQTDVTPALQA